MLNYCDIYPLELPARFSNKYACFDVVYIISNWTLEQQYSEVQKEDTASWQAFLRRISEVRQYKGIGDVATYHSVTEYFNRDAEFAKVSNDDEVPFK